MGYPLSPDLRLAWSKRSFRAALRIGLLGGLIGLTACGPATFTRTRYVWEPFNPKESRQQRDNVTVELKFVDELPPSFRATVARCDQLGRIVVDKNGRPYSEQISLGTNDQVWQQVALTNDTQNVIRLNGVVVRLFDPAGTQYSVMTKADLQAELLSKRPCPSTQQAMSTFAANPIFDRNIEIVPGTTSTFWAAFRPATRTMPGVWKIALYDVPVSLDPAGRPLRTTRFETRIAVKEVNETYRRDSLMAAPELLERREVSPSGTSVTSVTTPPSPTSAAAGQTASAATPVPPATATAADSPVTVNSAVITQAKAKLNSLGFAAGPADGTLGTNARQAIRKFQSSKGLAATGELNSATLSALGIR